ncbi:MAG: hypothetical protein O2973_03870 [Gemmatimonadetes bacterium]|nr:hypothetical protein [Gemmatimonadota bacterium]
MNRVTSVVSALAAAAFVGLVPTAAAQQRPDFSGEWTLATAAPAQGEAARGGAGAARGGAAPGGRGLRIGDMGSGWGSPITIVQDANRLTLQYAFFVPGDLQPPLKFVYALDGSETRNTVPMGRGIQAQGSKAVWSGNTLVITTLHRYAHPVTGDSATAEIQQALGLISPTSLVVEATRIGVLGGPTTTTRTVYTKR